MTTPTKDGGDPSALSIAVHAVVQLEKNPLFNSGRGAVFTRDGTIQHEASVMVSRGKAKRSVGVMGLRSVRHPILLAEQILLHGDGDLAPISEDGFEAEPCHRLDVPSAQGHTTIYGDAAEQLADHYGLNRVHHSYFFVQERWDEHVRGLERERAAREARAEGREAVGSASWSPDEYVPQGTCGAVALDADGVLCVATSTGGLTNKLTGRVGDTPAPGAGFWAEEWEEDAARPGGFWDRLPGGVVLSDALTALVADCLPTPYVYRPVPAAPAGTTTTRSLAISGTGNGDSFLRTAAAHTAVAIARFRGDDGARAVAAVAGPGGELQRSAGGRWGLTGEGQGGMIGVESVVERDARGRVVDAKARVVMDYNCGGMFRAWIDDGGRPVVSVWSNDGADS